LARVLDQYAEVIGEELERRGRRGAMVTPANDERCMRSSIHGNHRAQRDLIVRLESTTARREDPSIGRDDLHIEPLPMHNVRRRRQDLAFVAETGERRTSPEERLDERAIGGERRGLVVLLATHPRAR
jgi:hypothetical protein